MDRPPPTIYYLYGDDDLAISEFIDHLRERMGDPSTAAMNIQRFSGAGLDLGDMVEVSTSMPFLSPRRLIILDHAQRLPSEKGWRERFTEILESLPQTTALVIIEFADVHSRKNEEQFKAKSFIYKWSESHPHKAFVRSFCTPQGAAFIAWLQQHCKKMGGSMEPAAAHLLAELVAEDAHLAVQEINKLLDYVDHSRPIEVEDVERLTPFHGQSDVFAMVDAIGQRRGQLALRHLQRLLADEDPGYAFSMIARQFRLLIQIREALDMGLDPNQVLNLHPYVLEKITTQARNFSLADLEHIHHNLLSIDLASKSSKADREVELDSLIASLSS
jgi:DNA polymerase-3 subunit delta